MPEQAVSLDKIRIDGGTQSRAAIDESTVAEYVEAIEGSAKLPPLTVFFDGAEYWLADGFHRFHAFRRLKRRSVAASVTDGTVRDALLYSAGANATHGLRRSNADKRRAVEVLLNDEEWSAWSNHEIARKTNTSPAFVASLKADHTSNVSSMDSENRTFIHPKTGQPATMSTANIGKTAPSQNGAAPVAGYFEDDDADDADDEIEPRDPGGVYVEPTTEIVNPELAAPEGEKPRHYSKQEERDLSENDWLDTLPTYRILRNTHHEGRAFRRAALSYRTMQDSLERLQREIRHSVEDAATDEFSEKMIMLRGIGHPREWNFCRTCKGTIVFEGRPCVCKGGYHLW